MEILIVSLTAFAAAILTFFSGFGLGTLLTPVLMVFFPAGPAIALTGVVHFCNNLFKLLLTGRHADRKVLIRFGIPAVLAAVAGSWLLVRMMDMDPLFSYRAMGHNIDVYPLKFLVAILLLVFAAMDLLPRMQRLQFGPRLLPLGGALSGFFGGLSGNQGALRSAFLIKAGLSKEAFIATGVVVSTFVDFTRLSVYASRLDTAALADNKELVFAATLSAITGAYLGNRMLRKLTLRSIQVIVAAMLLLLSLALGAGLL